MKRVLILFLFLSSLVQAQHSIKGKIHPVKKYTWVLLYKVEGARQIFVKNTKIEKEIQKIDGKNLTVGLFEFELPADADSGAYRITYDLQNNGFVDFLFNKEDVSLEFNPGDTANTTVFTTSKENKLYAEYQKEIATFQYKIDSVQAAYFKNKNTQYATTYQSYLQAIKEVQETYNERSKGTLAHSFIKASERYNAPKIIDNSYTYRDEIVAHFFDKIQFSNKQLFNSAFLIDRIADYVFYMNYVPNVDMQEKRYMKAMDIVFKKATDVNFKSDIIQFFISQFAAFKNATIVDYLFENHFNKLPKEFQDEKFKNETIASMMTAIGRTAPDFSWEENGKKMSLSSLKGGLNYLLIFYSTGCSHCLKEVPQVFEFLKGKTKTKVIAFAMETSDKTWLDYKKQMPNWHHVLGLGKWENKIARMYQINSTPTYFVLGMDKKIIANPEKLDDLKLILEDLNN